MAVRGSKTEIPLVWKLARDDAETRGKVIKLQLKFEASLFNLAAAR